MAWVLMIWSCIPLTLFGQNERTGSLLLNGGYYVSAKSGLNFRDAPKGNKLGVFPLNTLLTLVEITDVESHIEDNNNTLQGKWLGVLQDKDTVYVFDQYLSQSPILSEIRLFWAKPYYESKDGPEPGFINLSELYFSRNDYTENPLGRGVGENPAKFNHHQTNRFLSRMGLSRKDTLYIFNLPKDSIYKFSLSELQAAAYMDPYGSDFEYGLNLEKRYTERGDNLAYVGNANPFQSGNAQAMIWEKVAHSEFPVDSFPLKDKISLATFTLSYGPYEYFLQSHIYTDNNYQRIDIHHIAITDSTDGSVISEFHYQSGESTFLIEAFTQKDEENLYYGYPWTGAFLKGKSPVFYGMYSTPFGCPAVQFIDRKDFYIGILCDNRH